MVYDNTTTASVYDIRPAPSHSTINTRKFNTMNGRVPVHAVDNSLYASIHRSRRPLVSHDQDEDDVPPPPPPPIAYDTPRHSLSRRSDRSNRGTINSIAGHRINGKRAPSESLELISTNL